jgi:hypothetical protein
MKGEFMDNKKRKVTLYLDTGSIEYLKEYSLNVLKSGSISEAVRTLTKEHEQNKTQSKVKTTL